MLISLKRGHKTSTFEYAKAIRHMMHAQFPQVSLFFQPADIVSQVLNAGLPAPIDIQVAGRDKAKNYKVAQDLKQKIEQVKGAVDVTLHQIVDAPQLRFNVDRIKADQLGLTQRDIASSLLISLSSSFQTTPTFWVNPQNGVNYNVAIQTPPNKMTDVDTILSTPVNSSVSQGQLLTNLGKLSRSTTAAVVSHNRIQNVYDIFVNTQDRDLGGVTADIQEIIQKAKKDLPRGSVINIRGQSESMANAFQGLFGGILLALVLIYCLLVMNFHSWTRPTGSSISTAWSIFRHRPRAVCNADQFQRACLNGCNHEHRRCHCQ